MIFRNVCFWVHRQLFVGFIALSCLLISAEVEATDGSWTLVHLKLYCFEEFLDFLNGKRSLDKPTLQRATRHLRELSKFRNDYLIIHLRPAEWQECRTEDEIVWPAAIADRQEFAKGEQWENNFELSRFASPKLFNWVAGDFIMSCMMFPLCSIAPYCDMRFYAENVKVAHQFIFINLRDGRGFVKVEDFWQYMNRQPEKEREISEQTKVALKELHKVQSLLGTQRQKSIHELSLGSSICGVPLDEPRKKRQRPQLHAARSLILSEPK